MSSDLPASESWERGRPARRSVDAVDAGGTPALPGAVRLTLGTNNVYALPDEEGVTLIDAGPDYEGAWEEAHVQLHAHGLDPAAIHTILLTHAHLDHAGLAARWQATGARILVGAADAPALAMATPAREHERTLARHELLRHGVPPDALSSRSTAGSGGSGGGAPDRKGSRPRLSPENEAERGRTGSSIPNDRYTRWAAPLRMTAVEPDGLLDDGACIGEAHRLRAIACPGHTPGTLLFLDTATGTLFTGDHLLPRMAPTSGIQFFEIGEPGRFPYGRTAVRPYRSGAPPPVPPADSARRRPSLPAYLASLHATRRLAAGTTIAHPGHGEPIADLAEAVDWAVRLLEQRARRALTQLRRGPTTAYEVARRMFPHLGPRHLRPTMAEVIGLLDLLAERRLAYADGAGDLVIWHATEPGGGPRQPDALPPHPV